MWRASGVLVEEVVVNAHHDSPECDGGMEQQRRVSQPRIEGFKGARDGDVDGGLTESIAKVYERRIANLISCC